MLVLTRRAGESVMIGDNVIVTVLEARGDVIRLGIQAPRDVQVHREEVYRELEAHGVELLEGPPPPEEKVTVAPRVVEVIQQSANTGAIGDGKIFVFDLAQVVRIRTGETDETAL